MVYVVVFGLTAMLFLYLNVSIIVLDIAILQFTNWLVNVAKIKGEPQTNCFIRSNRFSMCIRILFPLYIHNT